MRGHHDLQDPHKKERKKRIAGDKKRVVGGSRGSHQTSRGEVTPWRDQTEGKPTTLKKSSRATPQTHHENLYGPGTYKPTAQTANQKKYIQKETEKKTGGHTTHHPHTKKKRRGEKHMKSLTKKELYNRLLITRDIDDINRYRKTVDDVLKWLKLDLEKALK